MEVGAEEEEEGVLSYGERRSLGLWPPTMTSRSSRGEARAAPRGECALVALRRPVGRAANDRGHGGRSARR